MGSGYSESNHYRFAQATARTRIALNYMCKAVFASSIGRDQRKTQVTAGTTACRFALKFNNYYTADRPCLIPSLDLLREFNQKYIGAGKMLYSLQEDIIFNAVTFSLAKW